MLNAIQMRLLLIFIGLFSLSFLHGQESRFTKRNLVSQLLKNNGTLAIRIGYSIGEKPYNEQHIFIKKHGDGLIATILIDSGSYFVTRKNYNWPDTTVFIGKGKIDDLEQLEKQLFKKGLTPTYNCDGEEGRIIHNLTNVFFVYSPDSSFNISRNLIDSSDYFYKGFRSEMSQFKMINVSGGFVSFREELINLGVPFKKCKTHWWDK
jgi:hypothetical protein